MTKAKERFMELQRQARMRRLRWKMGDPRCMVWVPIYRDASPMTVQAIVARHALDRVSQSF